MEPSVANAVATPHVPFAKCVGSSTAILFVLSSQTRPFQALLLLNTRTICRIFNTPVVKFVVGIFGKEMMLHTVLVAEQSLALDSVVNGPMKEAQEKVVIWKDVDEQTFALFAEFVYTGEYTLPDGGVEDQSPPLPNIESTTADEFEDDFTKSKRRRKILNEVSVQAQVVPEQSPQKRTKFRDLVYRSPAPASPLVAIPANKMPGKHPNANFLIHARLYVLAERYDIRKLKPLALQNLHANLSEYCPFGEVFYRDVVLLARYAYENTPSREQHKDKDQLRQLVTCYVADEGSKAVARSKHCRDLIEEVGAFARDLVSELVADGGNQSTTFETTVVDSRKTIFGKKKQIF